MSGDLGSPSYNHQMKAILIREFGAPGVMQLEDVAPPVAGPGQVVVRVKAAGVNPVDTYVRSGAYARKPPLPHTPGFDIAGVIESIGSGITQLKPGDRVYGFLVAGGYAELVVCDESHVRKLPDNVSFEQGAALGTPYTTAWIALFSRVNARPGETALVHGASGGVGIAAVQIARAHGLRVIGTAGTEEGLQAIRDEGAHVALNHHTAAVNHAQHMIVISPVDTRRHHDVRHLDGIPHTHRSFSAALPVGKHLAVPGHHSRLLIERRSQTHSPVADRGVPGRRASQNSCWTSKVERAGRWPDGHRCTRTNISSSETRVHQ